MPNLGLLISPDGNVILTPTQYAPPSEPLAPGEQVTFMALSYSLTSTKPFADALANPASFSVHPNYCVSVMTPTGEMSLNAQAAQALQINFVPVPESATFF